ncbi:MAG: TRAP transporter substrate-binding protein DctP [Spirochaetales bacterium]|nr:TRAP transporter substrate-binding protein DctP [Spirochaetales bacterium]
MNKAIIFIVILILLYTSVFGMDIRLGSVAPKGSPWIKALNQIASDWRQISGGKVALKIYPGGMVGDEKEMLRKIKLRQLDAAAMTISGMNQISKGVMAMATPMMVSRYGELEYLFEKLGPHFEDQMKKQRYVVLAWIFIGWTYFFSKAKVSTPNDMRGRSIWVLSSNQSEIQAWKSAGVNPVPMSVQDVLLSLQSGKLDNLYATMTTAAAFQWFGIADHMLDMHWAPMVAGFLVSSTVWDKVPMEYREEMLKAAQKAGEQVSRESLEIDNQALATMKEYGLKIHSPSVEDKAQWKALMDEYLDIIIDKEFGRESYELVKKTLSEYPGK